MIAPLKKQPQTAEIPAEVREAVDQLVWECGQNRVTHISLHLESRSRSGTLQWSKSVNWGRKQ